MVEDFNALGFKEGVEQVRMLRQKYQNLAEVLRRRLDAGELTYRRYLGMAEGVYLASVENLQDVAISLRSISTIDPAALRLKIEDLKKEMGFSRARGHPCHRGPSQTLRRAKAADRKTPGPDRSGHDRAGPHRDGAGHGPGPPRD